MDLQLKGKIVVVTGGAKGIGAACVEAFAAEGAVPIIVGRSPQDAQKLAKEIADRGGRADVIEAELSSEDACRDVIAKILERHGRIDGIVHNAGVNDGVSLRHSPADFVGSLGKNILHVFALTHYALDSLIETRGFIVNISSKVADTGQGGTSGYAASKGAMNALTREWGLDLAQYGIRVNTVSPAEVMTPLYERWMATLDEPEKFLRERSALIPLGNRFTTSEEIAAMTVFLASPVSGHTTGQIVYPDGGYTHLDRAYRPAGDS
ncbi:MAG: SDR family oxidoreductase [Verrucomicrobiota bacterium]